MSEPPYQACLFDYGNTLIEFDQRQVNAMIRRLGADLARRFGPVEEEALRRAMDRLYQLPYLGPMPTYRELGSREQMEVLLDDLYGKDSRLPEEVSRAEAALQEIFVDAVEITPGNVALLSALRERVPLGLVSNYPSGEAIRRSLARLGIDGLFRSVVISGEVGVVKPHPRIFAEAIAQMGVDPARTLFVGDRWDADVCGARDAGLCSCHMVGFTSDTGFEERYRIYRPHHVARTLADVAAILGLSAGNLTGDGEEGNQDR